MSETPTPETDALEAQIKEELDSVEHSSNFVKISAVAQGIRSAISHARSLERRLAEATQQREELRLALENIRDYQIAGNNTLKGWDSDALQRIATLALSRIPSTNQPKQTT